MQGKTKDRWLQLCEQAAVEQDAKKLIALVEEINRILEEKERRVSSMGLRNNDDPTKQSDTA